MNNKKLTSLDVYCNSISRFGRIRRLTREEELLFFKELRHILSLEKPSASDLRKREFLLDKITRSCLPYVIHLAQAYCKGKGDPILLEELIAAGNVGLCRAVYKYNTDVGTPFYNYASNWIKAELRLAIKAHKNIVRKPANKDIAVTTIFIGDNDFPETEELVDETDYLNLNSYSLEDIDIASSQLPPLQQTIFRLHSGMATGKVIKFTSLSELIGCELSFVKRIYNEAVNKVQQILERAFNDLAQRR